MRIALEARKMTRTDSGIGAYTLNLACALLEEDKDLEAAGYKQLERFSWSTCAQATLAVYRELV